MTLIVNLRQNLDNLRIEKAIDETSLTEIIKSIADVDVELQNKDTQIVELTNNLNTIISEKIVFEQEKNVLSQQIAGLLLEKADLEKDIQILQKQRPQIQSESLVTTFRQSLDSMAGKLNEPASRANYSVNSMDVKLKTNLSLKDGKLQFQLPKPDDIIPPENLSTIEFTIKSSPKELDLSQHLEVPNLTGMTRDEAEYAITDAGFKLGTISEKQSNSLQGTVIAQLPSADSLAIPRTAIDITTSKIMSVEMPNLVGMDIDSAKEVLDIIRLEMGEITEQSSKSSPGIVLKQSIEAGTILLIGTTVDVTVAAKENVKVPDLIGKTLDMAVYLLRTAKLVKGSVVKKVSNEKPNTVLEQDPKGGATILEQSPVNLVIASTEAIKVPDVINKNINEARTLLESKGLRIDRIVKRTSTQATNTVLDQNPKPGSDAEAGMPVELVLANQDIEMIEGIGPERGSKLRDAGIMTITDLVSADSGTVSEIVGKNTAEKFISMGKLIDSSSNLGSLGIDKQSSELLVKAANIYSVDELKNANPVELYELCKEAVASGKVEVPAGYSIKQDDVKRWVEQAQ
ncbi:MAG: DUF4332 domain-containing protein [Methanosarcinales archaeon]|nr:DUF4332 domain-containing protein [Methanosarcinales archaeon]